MNPSTKNGPLWNLPLEEQELWWQSHFSGPKFRLKQVRDWVYNKACLDSEEMNNLPKDIKNSLKEYSSPLLTKVDQLKSKEGSADKFLYSCADGVKLESVLLRSQKRRTVCMSTQVGCALACTFCNTGLAGFKRNLSPAEMVEQVLRAVHAEEERISNIVVMGMGEPFLNYDNMMVALRQINHPQGLNLGARHITISTSGIKGGVLKLAQEPEQWGLAISLHAPEDSLRTQLMPINKSLPLVKLMEEVNEYIKITNRRVSFEYIMLGDVNSEISHAQALAGLLKGMLCHVNLIPYNPVPTLPHKAASMKKINLFKAELDKVNIPCTIRFEKGQDILAACGQLAHKKSSR